MKTYMFTVEIPEEALAENLPDLISESLQKAISLLLGKILWKLSKTKMRKISRYTVCLF